MPLSLKCHDGGPHCPQESRPSRLRPWPTMSFAAARGGRRSPRTSVASPPFLDTRGRRELDHAGRQAGGRQSRSSVPPGFIEDLENGRKRAPMSGRVSPYIRVRSFDWEHRTKTAEHAVFFPPRRWLCRTTRSSGPIRSPSGPTRTSRARAPVPDRRFLAARHVARLLPVLHALVRDRARHREVEKVHMRPNERALAARVSVHRVAPELETSSSRRRRVPAPRAAHRRDRRMRLSIRTCAACASATKGPRHADEDPDRRAWLDALTPRRRQGQEAAQDVVLHTHFTAQRYPGITRAHGPPLRARIVVRNQSADSRSTTASRRDAPREAPRAPERARVLFYVHDMVRGVRRPEDERRHRDSLEKHVRGATAGYTRPVRGRRAGGGGTAMRTRTSITTRHGREHLRAPSVKPGSSSSTSIRCTS